MKIVGVSGRKQSGKNTTANILHGIVMKERGLIKDFNIGPTGELLVLTTNAEGQEGWGEFDVARKDSDFLQYAEYNMWPYVKLYSFADTLKWICTELFGIPHECAWGTNEQKNQKQDHLHWELMPGHVTSKSGYGRMTAREFMQWFGTDIMRAIYQPIWVENTLKRIHSEQSELAIIADVRFENEVAAIEAAGGKVVRLTREIDSDDSHSSEASLDDREFQHYIDNKNLTIDSFVEAVKIFYKSI